MDDRFVELNVVEIMVIKCLDGVEDANKLDDGRLATSPCEVED